MKSIKNQIIDMFVFLTSENTILNISENNPETVDGQFYGYSISINIRPFDLDKIITIFNFLGEFSVEYSVSSSMYEDGSFEYIQINLKEPNKNMKLKNFLNEFIAQ
ncbi:hypothetical protein [Companilactobacillus jidongensis]|uniref:hypothetical protein n=1 Tax=Companilactobacillus jidongensis TaxID=2486006 RepID=UPI000F771B1F|nr:hypothetical protein [Companilactobacillus jidongensis]